MRLRRTRPFSLAFFAVALLALPTSCREAVAPEPVTQQPAPDALLGLPIDIGIGIGVGNVRIVDTTVTALQWATPLANDISRSAVIGPAGGSISISELGFRLNVPAGAVDAPTNITVTAVAGSTVAYEFAPHGLIFEERPTFVQQLQYVSLPGSVLSLVMHGAYFESRDDLFADGTAAITELIPTRLDFFPLRVRFSIKHFSGYIVAVD